MSVSSYEYSDDDDEPECRVCRGPEEEGRPLFHPCKCSGSIGLTHQDCLTSWLEVTHGEGKCELCGHKFKFVPQYAPNAPDQLPSSEVLYRICRRCTARWLPQALRVLCAIALWLIILPLSTAYIYHGWMVKPSAISDRWTSWDQVKNDTVGGAVIAIVIVVSFLSLMSFAEFLRFQWGGGAVGGEQVGQQPQQQRRGARERRGDRNNNNREGELGGDPIEGEIDEIIVRHHTTNNSTSDVDPLAPFVNHLMVREENSIDDNELDSIDADDDDEGEARNFDYQPGPEWDAAAAAAAMDDAAHVMDDDDEDQLEAFMRAQEEQEEVPAIPDLVPQQQQQQQQQQPLRGPINWQNLQPREDARFEPQFEPLQPAFADIDGQDDGPEMEINVALDELLGFRGPLLALIRNLLWLLVFNTAYLGTFAFAPLKCGANVYALLSNKMSDIVALFPGTILERIIVSMQELEKKCGESKLIYQPSQIAKIVVGYATFSVMVFLLQATIVIVLRFWKMQIGAPANGDAGIAPILPENQPPNHIIIDNNRRVVENNPFMDDEPAGRKFIGFLDCVGAIMKVVILLLIKMLFLPLMLGVWLDWATLPLFEKTWSDRIEFAGTDLFGSTVFHWVTGITFMLLVTVSVLQLREVVHPNLLAGVVRPQEPQPDLLGNLLQESGVTHTKRVLLSLGIYAVLLAVHIWLPTRLLMMTNLGQYLPLFRPKIRHVFMPQIQVPVELFIFHLCMLGVLEKYKNNIGEMQHHWLLWIGNYLGITHQILPHEVNRFSLLGCLPVFVEDASIRQLENARYVGIVEEVPDFDGRNDDIYPLWNLLISETDPNKKSELIRSYSSIMGATGTHRYIRGIENKDGKNCLSTHAYIKLPSASSTNRIVVKATIGASSNLLPTCIGPYRLKQGVSAGKIKGTKITVIEVWREVIGKPIPRPPEGWDDLGVGGAERHGRWAWGKEKMSEIENSVAVRTPFFNDPAASRVVKISTLVRLMIKMIFLLFISWMCITVVVLTVLNMPLFIGHGALFLMRVPDDRVHDPLAFAIGIALSIPLFSIVAKLLAASNDSLLRNWIKSFKPHQPHDKVRTLSTFISLWLVVCPVLLGFLYYSFVVGINYEVPYWRDHLYNGLVNWGTGTLVLNGWAVMCYFQMFTKRFWADIVFGDGPGIANDNQELGPVVVMQQGVDNLDENANRHRDNVEDTNASEPKELLWQGKDGAISHAFESIKVFILGWEWDKVDKQLLLGDCAYPILRHLAVACAIPMTAVAFIAPLVEAAGRQIEATAMFRILSIFGMVLDSLNSSKRSLKRWFQLAHKIARDDRYLVGEILLNYSPVRESAATS